MNRKAKLPFDPKVFLSKVNGGRGIHNRKGQIVPTLLKENQNHIVRPEKLMSSNPRNELIDPKQAYIVLRKGIFWSRSENQDLESDRANMAAAAARL